jgi:hypothetical protein
MAVVSFKRGDTLQLRFDWNDASGNAIDLTDCTARFQVRDRNGALILSATSDVGNITFDIPNGYVDLFYIATSSIPVGNYYCDLELTFPTGAVRSTKTFDIKVLEDITR